MVSTRHHPRQFPEPELPPSRTATPSKPSSATNSKSNRKSNTATTSPPDSPVLKDEPDSTTTTTVAKTPKPRAARKSTTTLTLAGPAHHPPLTLLAWLAISLPLVAWDTLYVLLRPHTMPGGRLHSPFWTPYALYGTIDYVYGWPAWNNHVGFTAAQASLNLAESVMYGWYLFVVGGQVVEWSLEGVKGLEVKGKGVNLAVLVAFAASVMTLSKTVLYWLNEAFSGFENIGHNSLFNLIFLWVIPNGAWIVLPSYMIYVLGKEILELMAGGNGNGKKTR